MNKGPSISVLVGESQLWPTVTLLRNAGIPHKRAQLSDGDSLLFIDGDRADELDDCVAGNFNRQACQWGRYRGATQLP